MQIITAEELKARIDKGEELHLLDVREPHERAEFNIGGAFVPLGQVQHMQVDEIEDWKDKEVICYCRSGNRSGQACMLLESLGFRNTKNLAGGMLQWQEKFGR
ncbi:MAG: rhodanese-like domain-containing protein [Bacteroidetes bacterium]|nr:rhodanese-like domain-containing protein [Bacteroidota bacterium]MBS1974797.1 rhodanese-like domain-containing protein [Bacteroidota bacterium]